MVYFLLFVIALFYISCNGGTVQATHDETPSIKPFTLSSPAFTSGGNIPVVYTCDSSDISPALCWNHTLSSIVSYALIMDDPDVPTQPWVHWLVYNIPATDTVLPAHFPADSVSVDGIKQGFTSFRAVGYGGPCPPNGIHRYYFKLYALDTKLNVPALLTKAQLLNAMKGHILAEADLMGRYTRKNGTSN